MGSKEEKEAREDRIRASARKRLKEMEKHGNIKDWDFMPKEDVFYITLLTGQEIEVRSRDIKFFLLGILSAIYQASGGAETRIRNLTRGIETTDQQGDHPCG